MDRIKAVKSRNSKPLPDALLRQYRSLSKPLNVNTQVERLIKLTDSVRVLNHMRERHLAVAVVRRWLDLALELGATPAQTIEEAHLKITYLSASVDSWVLPTVRGWGGPHAAGMLLCAAEAEARRWGLCIPPGPKH